MENALLVGLSRQMVLGRQLDVVANNIANLNTNGNFVLYSVGEDANDDGGDTALRTSKTNLRNLWERNDFVWPAAASAEEIEAYRNESAKK